MTMKRIGWLLAALTVTVVVNAVGAQKVCAPCTFVEKANALNALCNRTNLQQIPKCVLEDENVTFL